MPLLCFIVYHWLWFPSQRHFEVIPRVCVGVNVILRHLLYWAWGRGFTNSLSKVHNMGVLHNRFVARGMVKFSLSTNVASCWASTLCLTKNGHLEVYSQLFSKGTALIQFLALVCMNDSIYYRFNLVIRSNISFSSVFLFLLTLNLCLSSLQVIVWELIGVFLGPGWEMKCRCACCHSISIHFSSIKTC